MLVATVISANRPRNSYLEFAARHAGDAEPLSFEALNLALSKADATRPARLDLDRTTLRRRIVSELNIGFLLEGVLNDRPAVRVKRERRRRGLVERTLVFEDPEVGSFAATLLLPAEEGPHPAILGLHGHHDDDKVFARDYLGRDLASRGYVVLMPRIRAFDCSGTEGWLASRLLTDGFTLIGLHVYESLVALRYLAGLEEVDRGRIGLLSHSGGSSIANLLVRVSDDVAAQVTDYRVDFRNRCGSRGVHCETVPGLVPLAADINHAKNLPFRRLVVGYGFEGEAVRTEILAFFDSDLRGGAQSGNPEVVRPRTSNTDVSQVLRLGLESPDSS